MKKKYFFCLIGVLFCSCIASVSGMDRSVGGVSLRLDKDTVYDSRQWQQITGVFRIDGGGHVVTLDGTGFWVRENSKLILSNMIFLIRKGKLRVDNGGEIVCESGTCIVEDQS